MPPEMRRLQANDWLDDLREFPAMIVAAACQRWRQENTRRPTPGDIRLLCIAIKREMESKSAAKPPLALAKPEPKPADDVVRPYWRKLSFLQLTAAEQDLFRQDVADRVAQLPGAARQALGPLVEAPAAPLKPIVTAPLKAEDDPEVKRILDGMGAA